ncbi:hypothetical protein [Aeromicrobium sp. UC242_57]|uniref:hypothetical protein n=1 Tax=Aeromicrobium sp. UC242_57 TaxID=3374624 RepID=UPI003790EA7A
MDAVGSSKEIAFWLERAQAKTYRVEAFRNAAARDRRPQHRRGRQTCGGRTAQADQGHRRPDVRGHRAGCRRRCARLPG